MIGSTAERTEVAVTALETRGYAGCADDRCRATRLRLTLLKSTRHWRISGLPKPCTRAVRQTQSTSDSVIFSFCLA